MKCDFVVEINAEALKINFPQKKTLCISDYCWQSAFRENLSTTLAKNMILQRTDVKLVLKSNFSVICYEMR